MPKGEKTKQNITRQNRQTKRLKQISKKFRFLEFKYARNSEELYVMLNPFWKLICNSD